ncbi:hypothetical protein AB6D16_016375 [Vibrio cyclitrophicus]
MLVVLGIVAIGPAKTQDPRPKTQDPRPKTQDPRQFVHRFIKEHQSM